MFPLNDFNFVCCALATFSAAAGYKYSKRQIERRRSMSRTPDFQQTKRRRNSILSILSAGSSTCTDSDADYSVTDCPTPSESICDVTEPGTLKRKHRDELDNYTDIVSLTDEQTRRSTSPSVKRHRSTPPDDIVVVKAEEAEPTGLNASSPIVVSTSDEEQNSNEDSKLTIAPDVKAEPIVTFSLPLAIPPPIFALSSPSIITPSPVSSSIPLSSAFSIPSCKPSSAFTAFAGSSSGFASTGLQPSRPVWCSGGSLCSTDPLKPESNGYAKTEASTVESKDALQREDPLAAYSYTTSTQPNVTGEEDETVQSELKGVKLFIKRGDKEFSDGMLGHVKLLSHKDTCDERIVFRREPVWKVSMSVRFRPTIRCGFDEDQGALKITLKEPLHQEGVPTEKCSEQIVVYAFKRGKANKDDFASFARSVAGSLKLTSAASRNASPVI